MKQFNKQDIIDELHAVIQMLCKKKKLPEKYKDHSLTGNYVRHREGRVKPRHSFDLLRRREICNCS